MSAAGSAHRRHNLLSWYRWLLLSTGGYRGILADCLTAFIVLRIGERAIKMTSQVTLCDAKVDAEIAEKAEHVLRQAKEEPGQSGPFARLQIQGTIEIDNVKQATEKVSQIEDLKIPRLTMCQILCSGSVQWGVPSVLQTWHGSFPKLPSVKAGLVLLSDGVMLPWGGIGERGQIFTWNDVQSWTGESGVYALTFTCS